MQYYSGPPYGVSDMQQLVLAAASHHMLRSDGPPHHYYHHQQEQPQFHHQHQQYYQSSLQPHDFLEFYHRQGGGLHEEGMQGSHILLGLHHHQHQELQPKVASIMDPAALQLPLSHPISLGLECASGGILTSNNNINHDLGTHYKPVAVQDFADSPSLKCSRWSREETAALLRVRAETDALFRDSSTINDALWDEVSRRLLAEGFQRSAKNCKETFENVQKYAKKAMGSNPERQLEKECRLLEGSVTVYAASGPGDMAAIAAADVPGMFDSDMVVSDINRLDDRMIVHDAQETSTEPNSPASTSFGDAGAEQQSRGRKRKRSPSWRSMRAFFQDLAIQLMERQDALHKKFLAAIERREAERLRREESYKRQEMARLSREQELRAREHMLAATRDAALVAFLQKVTGETLHLPEISTAADGVAVAGAGAGELDGTPSGEDVSADGMKEGGVDVNSRRWPKVEVLALIRVRTTLEPRFQEAGPKAQLWEEVSSSLASLGFSCSSKRCKEKWENINKYFRKTKDNVGRKLRADSASKTCPYFHQLELLYERGILASPSGNKPVSTFKLEGSQTSTDLLECSSSRENQRNQDANGVGNNSYAQLQPGISTSDMPMPSNVQATIDGTNVMDVRRLPIMSAITTVSPTSKTTCSSAGNGLFSDGVHLQDVGVLHKTICSGSELGCMLGPVGQINVNCHPSQHFAATDGSHDGPLSHENCNNNAVMLGAGLGPHFLKEMLEVQQQSIYENHQLEDDHIKHDSNRTEMENANEEKDVEQRMEYPEEPEEERPGMTNQAASQHDSSILMALVHKLAPGSGGHSAEFDLSSPHSSCGQV